MIEAVVRRSGDRLAEMDDQPVLQGHPLAVGAVNLPLQDREHLADGGADGQKPARQAQYTIRWPVH